MSIQGVQPKLLGRLQVKEQRFALVDSGGQYILKPQTADYLQVPENEDLTMRLAALVGIEVPLHGLLYGQDGEKTYFIKRFDRISRKGKIHIKDIAQLVGRDRDTKYRANMEQVAKLIESYCTFPVVEKVKLLHLTLFSFLVGNEDMHLKNFSIIRNEDVISLTPEDMTSEQAEEYFSWFVQQEKERIALIKAAYVHGVGNSNDLDDTPESLLPVWKWCSQLVELKKQSPDEIKKKQKTKSPVLHGFWSVFVGAPGRNRTCDTRIRNQQINVNTNIFSFIIKGLKKSMFS